MEDLVGKPVKITLEGILKSISLTEYDADTFTDNSGVTYRAPGKVVKDVTIESFDGRDITFSSTGNVGIEKLD